MISLNKLTKSFGFPYLNRDKLNQIAFAIGSVFRYLEISTNEEKTLEDLFVSLTGDSECEELFQEVLGITREEFKLYCELGFYDLDLLRNKINAFVKEGEELDNFILSDVEELKNHV
jgi:hypothetical protein